MINSAMHYISFLFIIFSGSVSCFSSGVCVPGPGEPHRFRINLDSIGMVQCGMSPAPLKVLYQTEHHGACLAACAEFQGCSSYNYHCNTSKCELFCIPTDYSYIPNCSHYLVRQISKSAIVVPQRLSMEGALDIFPETHTYDISPDIHMTSSLTFI